MSLESDIRDQLKLLNQTMGQVGRAMGARIDGRSAMPGEIDRPSRGSTTRTSNKAAKDAESYDTASKEFLKAGKTFKEIRTSFGKWSKVLKDQGGYLAGLDADFKTFGTNIFMVGQHAKKLVDGMGRYDSALAKTTKAQSMLYANQLEMITQMGDFVQAGALQELTDSLSELDTTTQKALGILDEATGKLRTDLNFEDLAKKRAALGDVLADVAQNLSKTKFKNIGALAAAAKDPSAFFSSGATNKDALAKIAAQMETAGLIAPSSQLSMLNRDGEGNITGMKREGAYNQVMTGQRGAELLKMVVDALEKMNKSVGKTDKTITDLQSPFGKFAVSIRNTEGLTARYNKMLGVLLSGAAMKGAIDKLGRFNKELQEFNVAQIPQTYKDTAVEAIKMGMEFGKFSQVMQDNKRMLAIYGPQQFSKYMGGLKTSFESFGYNMEQAAELIAPIGESAAMAGVNIRDGAAMQNYTNDMMKSFQKVSAIVGVTAKEYADLTAQLYKAEGVFENLMGMDSQRSQAYANELRQMRDRYTVDGISIQQAQEMVSLNEKQKRDKVSTRFTDASKALISAQMAGMSQADAQRMMQLTIKGRGRNSAESDELNKLAGTLGVKQEQAIQGAHDRGLGFGLASEVAFEGTQSEGTLGSQIKAGMQREAALRAGMGMSASEAAGAGALAAGSQSVSKFGNVLNSASALINSAFLAGLVGSTVGLASLAVQARYAARSLGLMSAGAGVGGVLDKARGAGGGAMGKVGGLLGKVSKGGIAGLLGGFALDAASGMATDAGHTKTGMGLDIASDALGMAGTGAMLGSLIAPGVGTVIGGALGGVAGAGYGLYKNSGAIFGSPSSSTGPNIQIPGPADVLPPGINTPGQSGLLNVKDLTSVEQLKIIAQQAQQMVELLQKISEGNSGPSTTVSRNQSVPSAHAYVTGRS